MNVTRRTALLGAASVFSTPHMWARTMADEGWVRIILRERADDTAHAEVNQDSIDDLSASQESPESSRV